MDHVSYVLVLLIGLLCVVAAVAGLAHRLAVSYPIVLVIFGLLCSLLPHIPRIPLPPSLVFLVILPPLLYVAAWQTNGRIGDRVHRKLERELDLGESRLA
ncbi:CPA1 family monovalent cation:H+ antiporter [Silvibacterium bohemicum]|uniref:CPA1 family monovalent cation:H+ antiporter n=1 Tax=Silvibacterium bohemicum TaxID=1577686 RepID=A0A841JUJ6_9BACT|nr:hypothetical protein [Silvibacterium bohemicum]MBB6144137.1 CPA1 family monovalent cation:H+ antiporter [Silvibacterium bohemicum]